MKMNRKFQKNIKENFVELVNTIEPDVLINFLLSEKCIKPQDLKHIQVGNDYKHKNRLLLFLILKRKDNVYENFVKGLELFGLKHLFCPSQSHVTTVFHEYNEAGTLSLSDLCLNDRNEDTTTTPDFFSSETTKKPLVIEVKLSENFKETNCDNIYDSTSFKRGQVLIINNKNFIDHKKRKGSEIDIKCLEQLFKQMFMNVEVYRDLKKREMEEVILRFAEFNDDKISDICLIIIMSHGEEREHELVVLDKFDEGLKTSWIEEQFNNVNCPLFSGKPKVFLYQFCRGSQLDYATTKLQDQGNRTSDVTIATDNAQNQDGLIETDSGSISTVQRRLEDMLVGYATQKGHKAHRDPDSGSWYIQLISEVFMERAHNTDIVQMLNEVDRRLKVYTCPEYSMQTSSYTSNGFNKLLYFNPGIYLDGSGNVQKFS